MINLRVGVCTQFINEGPGVMQSHLSDSKAPDVLTVLIDSIHTGAF